MDLSKVWGCFGHTHTDLIRHSGGWPVLALLAWAGSDAVCTIGVMPSGYHTSHPFSAGLTIADPALHENAF